MLLVFEDAKQDTLDRIVTSNSYCHHLQSKCFTALVWLQLLFECLGAFNGIEKLLKSAYESFETDIKPKILQDEAVFVGSEHIVGDVEIKQPVLLISWCRMGRIDKELLLWLKFEHSILDAKLIVVYNELLNFCQLYRLKLLLKCTLTVIPKNQTLFFKDGL